MNETIGFIASLGGMMFCLFYGVHIVEKIMAGTTPLTPWNDEVSECEALTTKIEEQRGFYEDLCAQLAGERESLRERVRLFSLNFENHRALWNGVEAASECLSDLAEDVAELAQGTDAQAK